LGLPLASKPSGPKMIFRLSGRIQKVQWTDNARLRFFFSFGGDSFPSGKSNMKTHGAPCTIWPAQAYIKTLLFFQKFIRHRISWKCRPRNKEKKKGEKERNVSNFKKIW
jgi:hypothetical protein